MSVPRVLHRIWIGSSIPEQYEGYWRKWARLHPRWDRRTWRSRPYWLENHAEFDAAVSPAQKADILRYEILFRYGGVYVDCDVEPLKPLDDLLGCGAFVGYEDKTNVCNAVMGARPGHPLLRMLIERLPGSMKANAVAAINSQTGPGFLLSVVNSQTWDGLVVYPPATFYPYHWSLPDPGVYSESAYSVHHWSKAW